MKILVEEMTIVDGDHLFLEDTSSNDYIDNKECDGCGSEMKPISKIQNTKGDVGLVTGLCPKCGYIKRIRNLSSEAYKNHFSNKWLVRRDEEIAENPYVYSRLKPYINQTGLVLDVGCGLGGSLLPFYKLGYDVYGVEPSKHRSEKGKAVMDNIETGTAEGYLGSISRKFDVIYFFDVLQYIENPFYVLEMAINHLTEDGKIFIKMGAFGHKSNFSQSSHLGINKNFVNLYSVLPLLKALNVFPVDYIHEPCELILSKKESPKSSQIIALAVKTDENLVKKYVNKSLKLTRLKWLGGVTLKYQGRKTILKAERPVGDIFPVIFEHENNLVPILLK